MQPTFTVLLCAGGAAAVAAGGALPLVGRRRLPVAWIGWANALAAGLMLGVAYGLMVAGLHQSSTASTLGAVLGIGFVALAHAASGTQDLDLNRLDATPPTYGYQVLLVNAMHAAAEGVAIGAAIAVGLSFGVFMALAIAVHNVPEGTILSAVLSARGVRLQDAAGLAAAANANQVLLAVVTFALVSAAPELLPWALGFAVGALVQLVMVELLPESYRQAGRTSIALVTLSAVGMMVLVSASRP